METKRKREIMYGAYNLYVLRPSKIVDIDGEFLNDKGPHDGPEIVRQTVTFESIPSQIVIAHISSHNKHLYMPLLAEDKASEDNSCHYYDQITLDKRGLFKSQKQAHFVGLFPSDLISFWDIPDLEFIHNLGNIGLLKSKKYFQKPFSKRKLKPKYHQKLSQIQYNIEELQELKDHLAQFLLTEDNKPQIVTKQYITTKLPDKKILIDKGIIHSREAYAGTDEDTDVKKMIKLL